MALRDAAIRGTKPAHKLSEMFDFLRSRVLHLYARCSLSPFRQYVGVYERCDLVPYAGVVLKLMVGSIECADEPIVVITIDSARVIFHPNVSEYRGPRGVDCYDVRSTTERSLGLIEIDRFGYV